jgi:hypothetical protein
MDDSDRATAQEEMTRANALARRKESTIYINGQCWNCENVCTGLFCDGYCRDDHTKRAEADRRSGI